ncbi:MAG: type II toxin-antitoxin system PrlF family antitoxin [Pseudomonadota bacterium]
MLYSKLTQKYQTTIPQDVRDFLSLHRGDRVGFEIIDDQVVLKKIIPLDLELAHALEETLGEWGSDLDNEAYSDL